jgi:hypothetical protein
MRRSASDKAAGASAAQMAMCVSSSNLNRKGREPVS